MNCINIVKRVCCIKKYESVDSDDDKKDIEIQVVHGDEEKTDVLSVKQNPSMWSSVYKRVSVWNIPKDKKDISLWNLPKDKKDVFIEKFDDFLINEDDGDNIV